MEADQKNINLSDVSTAYIKLERTCFSLDPYYDEVMLWAASSDFVLFSDEVFQEIEFFKVRVSKKPLIALIHLWAQLMKNDKVFGEKYLNMMQKLLDTQLLHYKNSDGRLTTLEDLFYGPLLGNSCCSIDEIRCYKEWAIEKREEYVLFYLNFSSWLSNETYGYIPKDEDIDRKMTERRRVSFEMYIEIIKNLDLRERILAKIFYLGGPRSLEEVLSLEIKNLDFLGNIIKFSFEPVRFPSHIFEDLKLFIVDRKNGYVFISRDGERISHTTPFRALKRVVSKLDLEPNFTFKDLTKNI